MAAIAEASTAMVRRIDHEAPGSILASAAPLPVNMTSASDIRRLRPMWQSETMFYAKAIGEVGYANLYVANAMSRLRRFPAVVEHPGDDPVPLNEPHSPAQVALDDVARGTSGANGSRARMHALSMNFTGPGECYSHGFRDPVTGRNRWEILSVAELVPQGMGYGIHRIPGQMPVPVMDNEVLNRMWSPDPMMAELPWSAMAAALPIMELLYVLSDAALSIQKQRLAQAGIIVFPDEMDYKGSVGPDGKMTTFEQDFFRVVTTAIKEHQSPSRWVPLVVRGKAEYMKPEYFRWIELFKGSDTQISKDIAEALNRFAHTFHHLPAEQLTGLGELKYSNAWTVSAEVWGHLEPLADQILEADADATWRPMMIAAGMDPAEAAMYVIGKDEAKVVTKPDRSAAATAGLAVFALAPRAWRRDNDYPESDAPTDAERAKMFGEKWGDPGLAKAGNWDDATGHIATRVTEAEVGKPGESPVEANAEGTTSPAAPTPGPTSPYNPANAPSRLPGQPSPTAAPKAPPSVTAPVKAPGAPVAPPLAASASSVGFAALLRATDGNATNGHRPAAKQSARAKRLARLGTQLGAIDRGLMARISVMADERLHTAVRKAGARLRSAAKGRPLLRAQIDGVDNLSVAARLGPSSVRSLGLTDQDYLAGEAAAFAQKAGNLLSAAQIEALRRIADATEQDYEALAADTEVARAGWLDAAVTALAEGFTSAAHDFLYDPHPQAQIDGTAQGEVSDIVAPRGAIRDAMSLAGGGDPSAEGPDMGVGTGPMALDALASGDAEVRGYVWVYTDEARVSFPGHLQLDGAEFTSWDDERLAVDPSDDWVESSPFYSIGDHPGCSCGYDLVTIPASDLSDEQVAAATDQAEAYA